MQRSTGKRLTKPKREPHNPSPTHGDPLLKKTRLEICGGKHCRKHVESSDRLVELLGDRIEIHRTGCLKVCKKTPILALYRDGKREIFQKIRSESEQANFVRYLDTGKMPKQLKEHVRKK